MRFLILALAALVLTAPSLAQSQTRYDNSRFGYSIPVPEGFVGHGQSDNGDGQRFDLPGRAASLTVWGSMLGAAHGDFEGEVAARMGFDSAENWSITYQATSPKWASWSGTKSGKIRYQRMILLCDGDSYAAFRMEYGQIDRPKLDPIVEQLVPAFRGSGC